MKQLKSTLFFLFFCTAYCYSQNKVICTPPTVTPSANITICNSQSGTISATGSGGGGGPYTYDWTPTTNLGCPTCSNTSASPTTTTTYTVLVTDAALCTATSTVQVTVNSLPSIGISGTTTICNGGSTTLTGTGGSTYSWSTGVTTGSITVGPTTATSYTVWGTNAAGCSNTSVATVTITTPAIGVTASTTICNGSSATLTGSGGVSYSWSTGQVINSITVSPTTATSYTVWGTDGNGCTNTATTNIALFADPVVGVTGTSSTVCSGASSTLTASGGVSYSWSTGQVVNPITVNPTTATTYTVWGTDGNGCVDTSTILVSTYTPPSISISGGSTSICNGGTATLSALGGVSYSWSTGQVVNPITVNPTIVTTYTVWGTDGNGCTSTATSTVDLYPNVVASISGNTTICNGQTTTLTASGGTGYSWWNNGATSNPITENPTTTTDYTVTATDGNGCTDDHVITVVVNPLPTVNSGPAVSICAGSSTTLNGSGNGTYLWTPSTDLSCTTCPNPVANPTVTTTYTLTVTNSCGSIDDWVTVTINTSPSVNAGADVTICLGGSTTLNASGSGTYLWSPGSGLNNTSIANPTATPTSSTNYTVTITDICGTASDSVWVMIGNPVALVSGSTTTVCSGSSTTLTASGGTGYSWSTGQTINPIVVNPTTGTTYTVTVTSGSCTDDTTITVSVNSLPSSSISGSSTICFGQNDTLVASGGTSYSWNTGATTDTLIVSPTSATGYTVVVTDGNGCTNTSTINVGINPLPTAAAGSDATFCLGGSTTLSGSGNGSYSWSPAGGLSNTTIANPVANPAATTTYVLTVNNSCGNATDTVIVNVNLLPTVNITGNDTLCSGASTTLTASGGTGYSWNTGATTSVIIVTPSSSTGYTVAVIDGNGCSNIGSININVSTVIASVLGNTNICSGQSSTLTASGGGTYSWNTGQTINPIVVSPTGTASYTVTVTNASGCTDDASISVNVTAQPTATVSASSTTTLCSGTSSTLTASGGTIYSWFPSTGLNNNAISNPVANPTSTITYSVIVSNGGCSDTTSITLTVNPVPTASVTAGSASICDGDSTLLSATGGSTYVWNPGGQTTTSIYVSPTPTGNYNYTVTVTDASGCTDDAVVSVAVVAPVSASVNGNTNICAGTSTVLTAQGGSIYSWSNGATTSAITVSPTVTTTYSVIVSNGSCADSSASITVNVTASPSANATANPYTIIFGSQTTLSASGTGTYNWSPSTGLSCAACPNPVANPTVTTTYTLTVIDSLTQCTAIDTVTVFVEMACDDIFVPNAFSPNNDSKNDYAVMHIPFPCLKLIDFSIYNRWGQKVFFTDDPMITVDKTKGWDGVYQGKDCDPAVFFYILNVTFSDDTFKQFTGNITLVR